jgi:protein TonB
VGELAARDVYSRLLIAVAFSTVLHWSLIYAIAPRPGAQARPIAPLAARLVPEVVRAAPINSGKRIAPAAPQALATALRPPITVPALPPEVPLVAAAAANGAEPVERREDSALPKADLPFPVDLQWYEARDLDRYPRALSSFDPPYPASAQSDAVRGAVTLLLAIDESGSVHDIIVVSAEPAGYFEAAALASARGAQFAPAEKDGRPVRSKIIVKLRFNPLEQASR